MKLRGDLGAFLILINQKATLPSTLRRFGEELYSVRPTVSLDVTPPEDTASVHYGNVNFLSSSNLRVRFLSALIILKTINQGLLVQNYYFSFNHKMP